MHLTSQSVAIDREQYEYVKFHQKSDSQIQENMRICIDRRAVVVVVVVAVFFFLKLCFLILIKGSLPL